MKPNILNEICIHIDRLLLSSEPIVVAIDGNSASGKSTLAAQIAEKYECNLFHMDDYYLPCAKKTTERLEEAGGNVDRERFRHEILEGIKGGRSFFYRRFDCKKQSLSDFIKVTPKEINIIEGVYSMHPDLIGYYDLKIFLYIGGDEQNRRILARNGPIMFKRFTEEWIPLENRYFDRLRIKGKSDLSFRMDT